MNDINPIRNRKSTHPSRPDRAHVSVGPRVINYNMVEVTRQTVTPPVSAQEPTVTTQETVVMSPDPELSIRMAQLLAGENDVVQPQAQQAPIQEPAVHPAIQPAVEKVEHSHDQVPAKAVLHHGVPELPVEKKVAAMTRALEKARKELEREHRKKSFLKRLSLSLTAVVLLLSTGYVGINTWLTNSQVKAQAISQQNSPTPVSGSSTAAGSETAQGTDKTPLPAHALANYHVASNLPRAIYINKIGVAARILPMGVNTDDTLQAPVNIFDAGWYNASAQPGEPGAVLIDGHSSADHGALFGNLGKLVVGDLVQVEKGDGTRVSYKVVHTVTVSKDNVDMASMLKPYGNATNGLNLMTCAGDWIPSQDTLTKRILVYTVQI